MKNVELFEIACRCLNLNKNESLAHFIKSKISSTELDIYKFIRFYSHHLILPTIYDNLQQTTIIQYFPKDFAAHLKEIYDLNTARNAKILNQIDEITGLLGQKNIEPVFLKGTANLLDGVYPKSGYRIIGDIDFLVRDKDFLKAVEVLKKSGYSNDKKVYDDINRLKEYPKLHKDGKPAVVEVHRIPTDEPFARWFTSESIFKVKKKINNRINCYVPDVEQRIIHAFIHSQLSNKGHAHYSFSIRDAYDFYLLSKNVNWQDAITRIEEKGRAQVFYDMVHYFISPSAKNTHVESKKSRTYLNRFIWFLIHPKIHRIYISILKFTELIYHRIILAFFRKSTFSNLFVRVSDISWWKNRLLPGLKKHFS